MNYFEKLYNQKINFIDSGINSGQYNMDFDTQWANEVENQNKSALFRLYEWDPWCLSLGYNQKTDDIELEALKKNGYDIVKRPTGGRAVFHANELTYSFIIKLENENNEKLSIHQIYRDIHLFFIKSFSRIGIELDFIKAGTNLREFYQLEGISNSCFASSARYEVSRAGKKVVGSAQRVIGKTLLQHGSILVGPEHLQIVDLLKNKSEDKRIRLLEFIKSKSISLKELSNSKLNIANVKESIKQEFNSLA